jgi:hypothetical protein
MELTPYMQAVTDARSMLLSEEEALAGEVTLSLETCDDLTDPEFGVLTFIRDNFPTFLKMIRNLKPRDQDLLLSYYLLSCSQNTLAPILRETQTGISTDVRAAIKTLGTFFMLGQPTTQIIHEVLIAEGLESQLGDTELSTVAFEYSQCRTFDVVAARHSIRRPDVRKALRAVSDRLLESKQPRSLAIGSWLFNLLDHAKPVGVGYKTKGESVISLKDTEVLGQFRVDVASADFDQWFVGRANL